MNKFLISIIVIVVLFLIGLVGYYYYNNSDLSGKHADDSVYYNVSLKFIDNETKYQIITPFVVLLDNGFIYDNSTSTEYDYVREELLRNSSFFIINTNKGEQTYYSTKYSYSDTFGDTENVRISIPIDKIGNLSINQDSNLSESNPVNVNLITTGKVKNIAMCFTWSSNIIRVSPYNKDNKTYESISIPSRLLNKVNDCYNMNISLSKNDSLEGTSVSISYKKFGSILDSDYIRVYVLDSDYVAPDYNVLSIQDSNGNDIGLKDVNYTIR